MRSLSRRHSRQSRDDTQKDVEELHTDDELIEPTSAADTGHQKETEIN